MSVLIWGLFAIAAAWTTHFVLWQFCLPERQTRAILLIFLGVLVATCLGAAIAGQAPGLRERLRLPHLVIEYLYLAVLQLTAGFAYLMSYPAIEADSPSFMILLAVQKAGAEGLPQAALSALVTDQAFIHHRLEALVRDGLVCQSGDQYRATPRALPFLRIFLVPRKLLGITGHGG